MPSKLSKPTKPTKSDDPLWDTLQASGAEVQFLDHAAEGLLILRLPAGTEAKEGLRVSRQISKVLQECDFTGVTVVAMMHDVDMDFLSDRQLAAAGLARVKRAAPQ